MNDPRDPSPYAPPKVPPPEPRGIAGETRAVFDRLAGEVARDRAEAAARGPVAKALFAAALVAGLLAAGTLVYGMVTFPDGPIRATPGGYVNKAGAPRTREAYERYETWQTAVWVSFGVAFLAGFSAAAADGRRKRGRG